MKYKNIYTGRGDAGETDLFLGGRVSKTDERIITVGKIDTFHAQLGVARSHLNKQNHADILSKLSHIQNDLVSIMGEIAIKRDKINRFLDTTRPLDEYSIRDLDQFYNFLADALDKNVSDRTGWFIYGEGGNLASSHFFLASTLARESEIEILKIRESGRPIREEVLVYFNKLSKVLYLLGLYLNYIEDMI